MRTAPLKIVHVDTDDIENPLRGGQPVRTYAINSRLADRHDVTVLTSVYRGCQRRQIRQAVKYRRFGLRIPGFGLSPHLSFLASIGPVVARSRPDLVVEEFTPPVGFCGLPWWTRAPVILQVQWYFFEQWEKRYKLPFSRWMKSLAKSGRYKHVIVQTDAMHRELKQFLPEANFACIPSGIDDGAFINETGVGDYALFLGRIDLDHKGIDLLLSAWRKHGVAAKIPLLIAGEGPERPQLEAAVKREGLDGLIRFLGRVESEAKTKLLAQSRFVVMPSRYETFGIAAIEAMAAGRPVICFNIDHLNEVAMPPWAIHVKPFDVDALGVAVVDLWRDPRSSMRMGELARKRAESYRWDAIARQQEEFYFQVLSTDHAKA